MQTTHETTSERLNKTAQGRALLALLAKKPSRQALAESIGASTPYINKCVRDGQVSKSGAILFDAAGLMSKETLRPDLGPNDWAAKSRGLAIGTKPVITGKHQILLKDLAIHFKSVKNFCKAMDIDGQYFYNWKMRDRISSAGMLKLLALKWLTAELRARIKELQK
jgi:hypothetical protein